MREWMGYMKIARFFIFLLLNIFVSNFAFATNQVANFRISQAAVQLPVITTWLDITDEQGQSIPSISPEQLSITVGAEKADVKTIKPFAETNEGTAFIFLVDVSKSIKPKDFSQIQSSLNNWIAGLNEHDHAAVIGFGSQVNVLQDFIQNKDILKQTVDKLVATDNETFLYQGITKAFELGRRHDAALPKRRGIVVLTDGIDDAPGGVTKDEVLTQMLETRIPIYAIGFTLPPLTSAKENGLKELGILARTSGGHFLKADSMPLADAYNLQKDRIAHSYKVELTCSACKAEGQLNRLNINLNVGDRSLNDGVDIRLLPQQEPFAKEIIKELTRQEKVKQAVLKVFADYPYYAWTGLVFAIILIVGLVVFIIKSRRRTNALKLEAEAQLKSDNKIVDAKTIAIKKSFNKPKIPKYTLSFAVVTGDEPGKTYDLPFDSSLIIGRISSCDLALNDSEVSANHVEISFDKGILAIQDLGSTNGTAVNGVPIHTVHYLQDGDQILIGRTELRLKGLVDNYAN